MEDVMERAKAISERLKNEYDAQKVILFGSYARGNATADSDLDVLIIAPTEERFFERMATVRRLARDLCHKLPFQPIVLTEEEMEQRLQIGDQFVKQIIEEGIYL